MAEQLAELNKGDALRDWKLGNTYSGNAGVYDTISLGIPADYPVKEVCIFVHFDNGYKAMNIHPFITLSDTLASGNYGASLVYNPNDMRIMFYSASKSQLKIDAVQNSAGTQVAYTAYVYYR